MPLTRTPTTRKSSNLENMGLGLKTPSAKVSRIVSSTVLRDASIRRRHRVLSGIKASKPEDAIKHKLAVAHATATRVTLPTPPTSPQRFVQLPGLSASGNQLNIPNELPRPQSRPVGGDKMAVLGPERLAEVPVRYVRHVLGRLGPQYVVFLILFRDVEDANSFLITKECGK